MDFATIATALAALITLLYTVRRIPHGLAECIRALVPVVEAIAELRRAMHQHRQHGLAQRAAIADPAEPVVPRVAEEQGDAPAPPSP